MLTADAALLKPDYTDVELIYSRDKYREESAALWRGREQEAWTAMSRKRKREDSGRDDSKRQAIGFVEQVSHQKLATTSLDATCPGIFFFGLQMYYEIVAKLTCFFQSFLMKIDVEVTSL